VLVPGDRAATGLAEKWGNGAVVNVHSWSTLKFHQPQFPDMEKSTDAASPLLQLPTELRLQIYGYVVPDVPLSVPPNQFTGLLYSCKTILNELEPEICKHLAAAVNSIDDLIRAHHNGKGIRFTPPTEFSGWRNVTISRAKEWKMFMPGDPYLKFKDVHFDVFNITVYDDDTLEVPKKPPR
jgi:hypothetical protein